MSEPLCEECPLRGTRQFYGKGNTRAPFLVVTDAPSHYDNNYGDLLHKAAMKVFSKQASESGFSKNDFYFHPRVLCPHDPDQFDSAEKRLIQKCCRPALLEQVEIQDPEVVIPLGAAPATQVMGRATKIMKVQGTAQTNGRDLEDRIVFAMVSPSLVAKYPQHVATFRSGFNTLRRLVEYDYDEEEAAGAVIGKYEYVDDLQFIVDAAPRILAFDTENTGLRWYEPGMTVLTMQFAYEEGKAYVLPWDHPDAPLSGRGKERIRKQLRALNENGRTEFVGHNIGYDIGFTAAHVGVRLRIGHDTLMLGTLLDENSLTKNLDDMVKRHVEAMEGYADSFNQTVDKSRMAELPLDQKFLDYSGGDADATLRLFNVLYPQVAADKKLLAHYNHVTIPGLNAFASLWLRGMHVNEDAIDEFEEATQEELAERYRNLLDQVPKSIKRAHVDKGLKFSRADFVRDILFRNPDGFRLRPKVFTKSTAKLSPARRVPSTSTKDHLPYFYEECPFTLELAEYIKLDRLLTANVQNFREKYVRDGMVRPQYALHKAVTGRSSCLVGSTLVSVPGGTKRIDRVEVGDLVYCYDDSLQLALRPVTASAMMGRRQVVRVQYLTQGRREVKSIVCTADHRFRLRDGAYVEASALQRGDRVLSLASLESDNSYMVLSVTPLPGTRLVYDISVQDYPNFIANGVCVHNSFDPNGQNGVKHGAAAKAYRKMFVAPPGKYIIANDLSQAELRIAADMANDRVMLDIYNRGGDIHRTTAAIVLRVGEREFAGLLAEEQAEGRRKAKACIAKGQRVVTSAGAIRVEQVKPGTLVWDGISYVPCGGAEYQGTRYTIHWDGLEATPEHFVLTEEGAMPLYLAREAGLHIVRRSYTPTCCVSFFYGNIEDVPYLKGKLHASVTTAGIIAKARSYGFAELVNLDADFT